MSAAEAALFEAPFAHVDAKVRPVREKDRNERTRHLWWLFERSRHDLRRAIRPLSRYIVTPVVSKHRLFVWVSGNALPSNLLDVIARDDDTTFGILHSRFHEAWALRLGTSLEDRPRYTPTSTFETFPFPAGLIPNRDKKFYASDPRAEAIAVAARRLDELRSNWLNPPGSDAEVSKGRTLTNLYNESPTWLQDAHRNVDAAVAAAYGWQADIPDDDAVTALFELNQSRAVAEKARALIRPRSARDLREQREFGLGVIVTEAGEAETRAEADDPSSDASQKAS